MIGGDIRVHVHHIRNPTPHFYMTIRPDNIMHRTLQAADPFTTAFVIAQCQVVELPRMQRRTPRTHVAQARCFAAKRHNYCVFACVNEPICVPSLLSSPAQQGHFAHAKGCFCVLARKTGDAQNVQFAHAKGCFCVPCAKCASAQKAPFTYARMGSRKHLQCHGTVWVGGIHATIAHVTPLVQTQVPETLKHVCRPLKNPAKKLKRLKINEKFNLKNPKRR